MQGGEGFLPSITISSNRAEPGSLDNHPSSVTATSVRFRRRGRSDSFRHPFLLKVGCIAASLAIVFLLANCARAFASMRLSGSRARSLAENRPMHLAGYCGVTAPGIYQAPTGTFPAVWVGGMFSTSIGGPPKAPFGYPSGVTSASAERAWSHNEERPEGQRPQFTYPPNGGPLMLPMPRTSTGPLGSFFGVFAGEPLQQGGSGLPSLALSTQEGTSSGPFGLFFGVPAGEPVRPGGGNALPHYLNQLGVSGGSGVTHPLISASPGFSQPLGSIAQTAASTSGQQIQLPLQHIPAGSGTAAHFDRGIGNGHMPAPPLAQTKPHHSSPGWSGTFGPFGIADGPYVRAPLAASWVPASGGSQ